MEAASVACARGARRGVGGVRAVGLDSHEPFLLRDLFQLWYVFVYLCFQCRTGRNALRDGSRSDMDNRLQHFGATELHHEVRLPGIVRRRAELLARYRATGNRAATGFCDDLMAGYDRGLRFWLRGMHDATK